MEHVGWGTLGLMAGLALLGEALEATVGLVYTAKRGATRFGTLGAFVGGLAGAIVASGVAPPEGALLGAFASTFVGAFLFEYLRERQRDEQQVRLGDPQHFRDGAQRGHVRHVAALKAAHAPLTDSRLLGYVALGQPTRLP